jgi:hypothetical protein
VTEHPKAVRARILGRIDPFSKANRRANRQNQCADIRLTRHDETDSADSDVDGLPERYPPAAKNCPGAAQTKAVTEVTLARIAPVQRANRRANRQNQCADIRLTRDDETDSGDSDVDGLPERYPPAAKNCPGDARTPRGMDDT